MDSAESIGVVSLSHHCAYLRDLRSVAGFRAQLSRGLGHTFTAASDVAQAYRTDELCVSRAVSFHLTIAGAAPS